MVYNCINKNIDGVYIHQVPPPYVVFCLCLYQ